MIVVPSLGNFVNPGTESNKERLKYGHTEPTTLLTSCQERNTHLWIPSLSFWNWRSPLGFSVGVLFVVQYGYRRNFPLVVPSLGPFPHLPEWFYFTPVRPPYVPIRSFSAYSRSFTLPVVRPPLLFNILSMHVFVCLAPLHRNLGRFVPTDTSLIHCRSVEYRTSMPHL